MPKRKTDPLADRDNYSIDQFCARNAISRGMFYKLDKAGQAPKCFSVGTRRLISKESAAEWRRERERASSDSPPE
jgi:predicted DNA-binding transcriptional regulator AlpA